MEDYFSTSCSLIVRARRDGATERSPNFAEVRDSDSSKIRSVLIPNQNSDKTFFQTITTLFPP